MAPHSSTLAWKIPWTEEPGGLRSMWSQRVRHDRVTNAFTFMEVFYNKLITQAYTALIIEISQATQKHIENHQFNYCYTVLTKC